MITATWKIDKYDANPQLVANEIREIGDDATVDSIVAKAKDPDTELHKCFTWDTQKAAEKCWKIEAREVVRNLIIVKVEEDKEPEPTQIRLFHKTVNGEGYKTIKLILNNMEEYEALLSRCRDELLALKRKYSNLQEFQEIWDLIN